MMRTLDEKGRLTLPESFRPGEAVEVEMNGADQLVVRRSHARKQTVRLVTKEDGSTLIEGLPAIDSAEVSRLLEDYP